MGSKRTVLSEADIEAIIARRKAGADISELARTMHVAYGRVRSIMEEHGLGSREGKRYRLPVEVEKEAVARYAAGESSKALGAIYGCDALTIRNAARRAGVPINHVGGDPKVATPEEIAAIRALAQQGLSATAIAARLGSSHKRVRALMIGHRILARKVGVGRGAQHAGWKGGRSRDGKGYVLVRIEPDHPFASMRRQGGYVQEHRLVMAQYLGRPLTRQETVHHKNGDIGDNRIENLQLCIGNHSNAQAFRCLDCGSHNVIAVDLTTHQPLH